MLYAVPKRQSYPYLDSTVKLLSARQMQAALAIYAERALSTLWCTRVHEN